MQALILAAGIGKRLGKYTRNATKSMVEVAGKTLLERAFSALIDAGVQRFILVVGYRAEILREFVDQRYPALEVEYIENPDYETTNNIYSLWLARDRLLDDHTLLLESDVIFHQSVISRLIESAAPDMAVVSPFERWMDGTVATLDADGNVARIIDRAEFRWEQIGGYYKTVNIYKFSREFSRSFYLPFLEAYIHAFGHNQYYEQVLSVLAKTSATRIKALQIDSGTWYEIDDPHDLSIANTLFTGDLERYDVLTARTGGYWRYPHLVDFRDPVLPGYPPAAMITELELSLPTLLTGRPSDSATLDLLAANYLGVDPEAVVAAPGMAALLSSIPGYESADFRVRAAGDDEGPTLLTGTSTMHIVDESGLEFCSEPRTASLMTDRILPSRERLVVVKDISDYHGVSGLNLAIGASGNRELVAAMRASLREGQRDSLTEYWLQIAPKYRERYLGACRGYREARDALKGMIQRLPRAVAEASGPRHLRISLNLSDAISSHDFARLLLSRFNLLVAADEEGRGPTIRVACRSEAENERLTAALRSLLHRS